MALTVGELLAVLDVDDSAMRSGLAAAESDARRSGENIGDGVVRGADGRLRDLRGRFVTAGRDAGEGLASSVEDSAGAGAEAAGGGIATRIGDSLKAGLAAVGLAAGALLAASFGEALSQGKIVGKLGAQLGATPAEAERYGKLAGKLYANAVTDDFQGAADAISAVMRAGIAPPDATEAQLERLATGVSDLASTFELDLGQTANAVGQMIKTGLAKNGTEALDALTAGLQKMGPRADDIADSFNEYSVIFQRLGIDATTATGLLSQGLKAGARDTDTVSDALKEFTIEGVQGSEKIASGFKNVGLNSDEMIKKIGKGGPEATEALQMTLDALRKMEDPIKRDAAATELFGTKSEDMQKALLALDPSKAVDALGQVGGKADEMGNALRDNAGTRIEQFKRGMQQNVVDFLGGTVIPGMEDFRSYVTGTFGGIWSEAAEGANGGVDQFVNAFGILGERLVEKVKELGPIVIESLIGFGQTIADYVTSNPTQVFKVAAIAGAILIALSMLPLLIAGGLAATAGLIVFGFVEDLISSLGESIPRWWSSLTGWIEAKAGEAGTVFSVLGAAISTWFSGLWSKYVSGPVSRAWASFISGVQGLPGRAVGALGGLGGQLSGAARAHWDRFKQASVERALSMVSWVRGLPRMIASAVGTLGNLLYGQGQDVVRGLLSGIQGMGGWLKSQLISFAKNMIPGPIAKALGIASPSRLMRDKIGRWIPAGIVDGIKSGAGAVARTMRDLVPMPSLPSLSPAGAGGAVGTASTGGNPFAGSSAGGPVLHVEHWHAAENGSPDDNAKALQWLAKARG
ncbi:phage tail tape measure protein [Streptomyces sp. NPDC096048]|uniref:phage tail tape measure protein n=1 Tax=Streptomyces sp. NPDC096048 TaxID=3366072 RepID=UPI00380564D0